MAHGSCHVCHAASFATSNQFDPSRAQPGDVATLTVVTSSEVSVPPQTLAASFNTPATCVKNSPLVWRCLRPVVLPEPVVRPVPLTILDTGGTSFFQLLTTDGSSLTIVPISNVQIVTTPPTGTISSASLVQVIFEVPPSTVSAANVTVQGNPAACTEASNIYTCSSSVPEDMPAGNGILRAVIGVNVTGDSEGWADLTVTKRVVVNKRPGIVSVTASSNGPNPNLAKEGDIVTVVVVADEEVDLFNISIDDFPSTTVQCNLGPGNYSRNYTCTFVTPGVSSGLVRVSLLVTDQSPQALQVSALFDTSVMIDNVIPTLDAIRLSPPIALAGQSIQLDVTASENMSGAAAVINGKSANCTCAPPPSKTCTCRYTVAVTDLPVASVAFSVVATDLAGNPTSPAANATTDGSSTAISRLVTSLTLRASGTSQGLNFLVRSGDRVNLTIVTSDPPLSGPTATIGAFDAPCAAAGANNTYTCARVITDSDAAGPLAVVVVVNGVTYTGATDGVSVTRVSRGTVTITSSNILSNYARAGEFITLRISGVPETPPNVTTRLLFGSIMGRRVNCLLPRSEPGVIRCRTPVGVRSPNGIVVFDIKTTDPSSAFRVNTTTDGSSVTVDTVIPKIPFITMTSSSGANTVPNTGGSVVVR